LNTDERRAKKFILEQISDLGKDLQKFEEVWKAFLSEKRRYGKPQAIRDEFIIWLVQVKA